MQLNKSMIGTISKSTLNPEQIARKNRVFVDMLRIGDFEEGSEAELETFKKDFNNIRGFDDSDILDIMFSMLSEIAPEGCFFGAHPGDDADFGFWDSRIDRGN